ncbi:hypothetical protein BGX28_000079 [Mortierella sp. GBA30]|nr:hypothetical protein BGX28_000079 [Mortierella sp. GBA30]
MSLSMSQGPPILEPSDEEMLVNAMDAWHQVYLQSFMDWQDPIRQMRIENKELDDQWNRLLRGRQTAFGVDYDFDYLERLHILEYGLEVDFMERYNLAILVHDIFMPELELQRLESGLAGYVRMFRTQLTQDTVVAGNSKRGYWKTFMQLIMLVMALRKRQDEIEGESDCNPREIMEAAWIAEGASDMTQTAILAAKDENRLYGLYQHVLLEIPQQIKDRLQQLRDPTDADLIKRLKSDRVEKKERLYKEYALSRERYAPLEELDPNWFEDLKVISGGETNNTTPMSLDRQNSFPTPDESEEWDDEMNYSTQDFRDTEMDEDGSNDLPANVEKVTTRSASAELRGSKHQGPGKVDKGKGRCESPHVSFALDVTMEGTSQSQDQSLDTDHQQQAVESTSTSTPMTTRQQTRSILKTTTAEGGLQDRVNMAIGIAKRDAEPEFGGDSDEEFIPPVPKKKRSSESGNGEGGRSDIRMYGTQAGLASPAGGSSTADANHRQAEVKARKKTRAWTQEEEDTLMALVPRFRYHPSETSLRKRTVKWAKLKEFDRQNGNILKHRDQVMLKDKYREKTDRGQHRQLVSEIAKARSKSTPQHQFPQTGPKM